MKHVDAVVGDTSRDGRICKPGNPGVVSNMCVHPYWEDSQFDAHILLKWVAKNTIYHIRSVGLHPKILRIDTKQEGLEIWVVVLICFLNPYLRPCLGKIPMLTNIFRQWLKPPTRLLWVC